MAARPLASTPLTPLVELEPMVTRAGLSLNAGQLADLALAWRQITELLGRIPREETLVDDQAYVFRVAPPVVKPAPMTKRAIVKRAAKPAKPGIKKFPGKSPAKPSGKSAGRKASPARKARARA